jgi:hypothetical protein
MSLKTIIIGTGTFMEVESNDPGEFPLNRVERKDKNHLIVHAVKIDGKWCVLRKIKEPALPKVRVIILNSHCGNITYMDELNRFYYTLNSVPGV